MGEPTGNQHQALDPLRLDRCPDCGYLLTGLPEQGVCPECGFAYNSDMIVLYGRASGRFSSAAANRQASVQALVALLPIVLLVVLIVARRIVGTAWPGSRMVPWPMFVVYGSLVVGALYRRWRARQDELKPNARWQLRLSPQGFAQRDYIGPVQMRPWAQDLRVEVRIRAWSINLLERRWPVSRRRLHIRILKWKGRFRLAKTLIDFQFDCQNDVALRVGRLIEQWKYS